MEFYIDNKDWKKIIDYAQASYDEFQSEIGGFLVAKKNKEGDYILSEPEILKQEVTGGTTEMDREAVSDYYVKCSMKHGPDVRFVWWHSHANMSAFWSGTDTSTMEEYNGGDWAAFLVVNIRQEYKFRVCVWNPIKAHKDIDLNIMGLKERTVSKSIRNSVSKLCSKPEVGTISSYDKIYKKSDQGNFFGYSYGNYGYNGYTTHAVEDDAPSPITFEDRDDPLVDSYCAMLDEINALYTEGTLTFKEWLKQVKDWNKLLKKKDANFNIDELTENELHYKCGFYSGYNPMELLTFEEKNEQNIKV